MASELNNGKDSLIRRAERSGCRSCPSQRPNWPWHAGHVAEGRRIVARQSGIVSRVAAVSLVVIAAALFAWGKFALSLDRRGAVRRRRSSVASNRRAPLMGVDGTYGFVYCGNRGLGMSVFSINGEQVVGRDLAGSVYDGPPCKMQTATSCLMCKCRYRPGSHWCRVLPHRISRMRGRSAGRSRQLLVTASHKWSSSPGRHGDVEKDSRRKCRACEKRIHP